MSSRLGRRREIPLDSRRPLGVGYAGNPGVKEGRLMSDQPAGAAGAIASWIKTTVASIFALLSGAVIMYASPLLDRVIKPAKPLANFEYQADGLKVTFHNRSTGGVEGLWDFGDGTALEPFTP